MNGGVLDTSAQGEKKKNSEFYFFNAKKNLRR